ncbi:MAG: hypothetical protein QXL96_00515 [Ignisphaera sp.]
MIEIRVGKQIRDLYLVIYDPRKLVRILDILSHFKVRARGVDVNVKRIHGVILLDSQGYRYLVDNNIGVDGYVIDVDVYGLERSIAKAIIYTKTLLINPIKKMIIGIDHGKSIGIAVIVNDDVIYTHSYRILNEALEDIKFFVYNLDSELKIVRVGIANNIDERFVNRIVEMFKDMANIEFVPEYKSSKHKYLLEDIKLTTDELAAINIALYRSNEVE